MAKHPDQDTLRGPLDEVPGEIETSQYDGAKGNDLWILVSKVRRHLC